MTADQGLTVALNEVDRLRAAVEEQARLRQVEEAHRVAEEANVATLAQERARLLAEVERLKETMARHDKDGNFWHGEWAAAEERAKSAEAQLADLAGCIRVELHGVIEEVEAFNRCTQFKVLLAQREEGSTWGVWSFPLPSADAARALGANLYRPTSAVVFLRVPEAP